ncbi:MAG: ABC transporter permease [Clostridia bacterium]|nr:ABC transporter permease [Clostridia bacterium]
MVKKFFQRGYVFLVLAFLYAPILLLVVYSFNASKEIGTWSDQWNFSLYTMLFTDDKILTAVWNTLILAFVSATISTILGTIGAIGAFYSKKRTQQLLGGATQIPVISAEIVTGLSLAMIFVFLGFYRTWASLIIGHVVICFPFVFLNVMPKLKQLNPNLYEAGLDLGASPTKALFSIILPEIMPGIFSGFLLAVTMSLDDYIVTTFTKPATLDTISTYTYNAYAKGGANTSVPALRALSTIIFVLIISVVLINNIRGNKAKEQARK